MSNLAFLNAVARNDGVITPELCKKFGVKSPAERAQEAADEAAAKAAKAEAAAEAQIEEATRIADEAKAAAKHHENELKKAKQAEADRAKPEKAAKSEAK